jgi:hypothetical protein
MGCVVVAMGCVVVAMGFVVVAMGCGGDAMITIHQRPLLLLMHNLGIGRGGGGERSARVAFQNQTCRTSVQQQFL